MQDVEVCYQLHSLETRLHSLTAEDKEALEEESAQCTRLIDSLYRQASQSAPSPVPQATYTGTPEQEPSRLHVPTAAASSQSQEAPPPLLLGPPS